MLPARRLQGSVLSLELVEYFILFQSFFKDGLKGYAHKCQFRLKRFAFLLGNN